MAFFNSKKIIVKNLHKEFGKEKITLMTYNNLEKVMIKNLQKKNSQDLNESKIDAEMAIQHMELHNFDNFVAIRLGYYAITLGIIAIIFSSQDLLKDFNINTKYVIWGLCIFMSVVIISHNLMSDYQKENLVYYRFKLKCIDKILLEKNMIRDRKIK